MLIFSETASTLDSSMAEALVDLSALAARALKSTRASAMTAINHNKVFTALEPTEIVQNPAWQSFGLGNHLFCFCVCASWGFRGPLIQYVCVFVCVCVCVTFASRNQLCSCSGRWGTAASHTNTQFMRNAP